MSFCGRDEGGGEEIYLIDRELGECGRGVCGNTVFCIEVIRVGVGVLFIIRLLYEYGADGFEVVQVRVDGI